MRLKDKFEEFLDYLAALGRASKTIHSARAFLYGALSHSVSEKKIGRLTFKDVTSVIEAGRIHGKYGPTKAASTFRNLLHYLKSHNIKSGLDWRDVGVPRVPDKPVEFLGPEEIEVLRKSIDISKKTGLRLRALVELLLATGLRISEALALNRNSVNWEKKEAQIVNIKTKALNWVYFTDKSLDWVGAYLHTRTDDKEPLFAGHHGKRLLANTARAGLDKYLKKSDINKHIYFHLFRKTFVTRLIQGGVDPKTVQVLARHKSERTTLRHYAGTSNKIAKIQHNRVISGI